MQHRMRFVAILLVFGLFPKISYADSMWTGSSWELSEGYKNACGRPKIEQKKKFLKAFKVYQSEVRDFSAKAKSSDEKYGPTLDKAIADLATDPEITEIFRKEEKRLNKTSSSWVDFYNELQPALQRKILKAFGNNPSIKITVEKDCYCDVPFLSSQISLTSTKLPLFVSPVHLFSDDTRAITIATNPEKKESQMKFRVRLTMSTQEQFEKKSTFKVEELGKRLSGIALKLSSYPNYTEIYGYFPWIEFNGTSNGYGKLREPKTKEELDTVYRALFSDELLERAADELAVKMGNTLLWEEYDSYFEDYRGEEEEDQRLVDSMHSLLPLEKDPSKKAATRKALLRDFRANSRICGTRLDRAFYKALNKVELEKAESEAEGAL